MLLALTLTLLSAQATHAAPAGSSLLLHGGRILLGDDTQRSVEALLARDGRVEAVGTLVELQSRAQALGAQVVDLAGAVAVPGLHDAHGHVEAYGAALEQVDLTGVPSLEALVQRVAERAKSTPKGEWILGRGWDQNLWPDKSFPHHRLLSAATPDHPVYLDRVDGHAAFANAAALQRAGLAGELPPDAASGADGMIVLDAQGRASGVLVDNAMQRVQQHVPTPSQEVRTRRILKAQAALLAHGLVAVHDMGLEPEQIDLYRKLDEQGLLLVRISGYLWGNDELGAAHEAVIPGDRVQGRFALRGLKLMADGALGSRGAALLEDYSDQHGHTGLMLLDDAALAQRLEWAGQWRLQPAIHAIGDRANRVVLDAYERALRASPQLRELRPRMEHAQVVSPKDWARFAQLGVVPSMQPVHLTSDMPWAGERLGAERLRGAYAWKSLAPDLTQLAFGSDFPVESPDPLAGLYSARTRAVARSPKTFEPSTALTGAQALAAFTQGAAHAVGAEANLGRLSPGYRCDVTVLSVDPVACEPQALHQARVLHTIIDGRLVYTRGP